VNKFRFFRLVCLVVLLGVVLLPAARSDAGAPTENRKTSIVFLGTGTPIADPDRSGPSVAIVVNGTPYLVDFGPGVIRRAEAARRQGVSALDISRIKVVFVTHLHSDHTAGYPDLILTPWVEGRREPLEVYGPEGIADMTDHILEAYQQDINIRLYGLEPANVRGYRVNAHEIEPGVVYEDSNVTVHAFPVHHGSWPYAFGYKFITADRTIVISGDTSPTPSLIEAAVGCDVLVHEVYSKKGFDKRSPLWQRYHSSFHTSSIELAGIAAKVKPGLLILYHQLFWGASEQELLEEIRKNYEGNVVSARDLEVY